MVALLLLLGKWDAGILGPRSKRIVDLALEASVAEVGHALSGVGRTESS